VTGYWRDDAACLDHPSLFQRTMNERPQPRDLTDALAVCADCPVQWQCAQYALTHHVAGVAGGMLPEQRERLRQVTA
jgi:hypothetical protein